MQGFEAQAPEAKAPQQSGMGALSEANLTPQQRATIEKFVMMGTEMLIDEKFMQTAGELIQKYPSTEEGMAQVGTAIATRIYLQSVKEGNAIPLELVIIAGAVLMEEVAQFAQAAGKEIGPETVEDAFYRAADLFREILNSKGLLDEGEMSQGYEQLRQQYGDDTFEVIGQKVGNIKASAAPQAPQPQGGAQ